MFTYEELHCPIGRDLVNALFYELSYTDTSRCLFTMKRTESTEYKSFPLLYLSLTEDDPTEYTFASIVFGDWDHWEKVANSPKLKTMITKLRKERDVRIKSKAIIVIAKEAAAGTNNSYQASKYLVEKNLSAIDTPAKRKTKTEKEKETEAILSSVQDDAQRLGLRSVK